PEERPHHLEHLRLLAGRHHRCGAVRVRDDRPFPATPRRVNLTTPDGCRLRATVRGDGPPIVLVHGWKGSRRVWDRTIASLDTEFRVVAYDLRGMGESDKPDSRYDFDEHAADLAFVLEALELDDATLVGWSMGCSVSLQHMSRGGARVGRLVLVNGPIR